MSRNSPISRPAAAYAYLLGATALALLVVFTPAASVISLVGAGTLFLVTLLAWRFSARFSGQILVSVDDLPSAVAVLVLDPLGVLVWGLMSGLATPPRFGRWSRCYNMGASGLPPLLGVSIHEGLTRWVGLSTPDDGAFAWFAIGVVAVLSSVYAHYILAIIWERLATGTSMAEFFRGVIAPLSLVDPATVVPVVALVTVALQVDGTARLLPVLVVVGVVVGSWLFIRGTEKQVSSLQQRDQLFRAIFVALARLLEMRDQDTALHSAKVAVYARDIAREMGLGKEMESRIHLAGLLHDVGKVGVPDEILLKPGRLEPDERVIMERHARLSAEALADIPGFGDLTRMIYAHHERLDGSGYPEGSEGQAVPLGARILGVADTFEAITSKRPYRPAQPATEALRILQIEDHLFDQTVVFALQTLIARHGPDYADGEMAEFAAQWREAGQRLVSTKDEPFVLPPDKTLLQDELRASVDHKAVPTVESETTPLPN